MIPTGDHHDIPTGTPRLLSEINVTPFIDVMLVLLIIFMVAAPLMMAGVPLKLPQTTAQPLTPPKDPVIVSLDRDGRIFVGKDPAEAVALTATLTALRQQQPDLLVYVRGDKGVDYGQVMALLGRIGEAGVSRLSLVGEGAPPSAQGKP